MPDDSTSEIFSAAIVKISGQKMEPLLEKIDPKFRMSTSVEKVPSWIKNNAVGGQMVISMMTHSFKVYNF